MTRIENDQVVRVRGSYVPTALGTVVSPAAACTVVGLLTAQALTGSGTFAASAYSYVGRAFVTTPTTRVAIDPNIRVRGNGTYAGFEDVTGPIAVGEEVEVYEPEGGLVGTGRVTEIDGSRELVYLSVDWASLTDEASVRNQPPPTGGLLFMSPGSSPHHSTEMGECGFIRLMSRPCLVHVGVSDRVLSLIAPALMWPVESSMPCSSTPLLEVTQPGSRAGTGYAVAG